MTCRVLERDEWKHLRSPEVNYSFNMETGLMYTWGKTKEEDPEYSPYGPFIADVEVTTVCTRGCKACYKSNTPDGHNMPLETFKTVLDNLNINHQLTQIAFGADSKAEANPDLWKMMEHCRSKGIIPNITVAEASEETADKLAKYCGAVAVSRYLPEGICYDTVKMLTDRGMDQVNIHQIISKNTLQDCFNVIDQSLTDPRLEKLNAIVFLTAKPIGRGTYLEKVSSGDYKRLVEYAFEKKVRIGFDSCGAPHFLKAVESYESYNEYKDLSEPCESGLYSIYVDTHGKFYPCSFMEKCWPGIDLTKENMELKDYWFAESTCQWRRDLLATAECDTALVKGCRQCPKYDIY